jgi:uncharacterized Zn finger protein
MKMKKLRFSKEGFGKVRLPIIRGKLPSMKAILASLTKGGTKTIQEEIDREIIEALKKKQEKEKFKETLEEFSTKFGEDE